MAQIDDFLNTLQVGGKSIAAGSPVELGTDYSKVGKWSDLLGSQRTSIIANLLATAQKPGGILSSIATDQDFATQSAGLLQQNETASTDLRAALASQGVAPEIAARIVGENNNDAMAAVMRLRGEFDARRRSMEYEGMQTLAEAAITSDDMRRQGQLELNMWNRARKDQKRANKLGFIGSLIGAGAAVAAAPMSGGTSLFGKWMGDK